MEPLVKTKNTLIWIHMYPADDENDDQMANKPRTLSRIIIAAFFIISVLSMIASLTFSLELMSVDLQQSLLALIPAASTFNLTYDILAGLFLRHKIKRIFTKLSTIYNDSEYCLLVSSQSAQIFFLLNCIFL